MVKRNSSSFPLDLIKIKGKTAKVVFEKKRGSQPVKLKKKFRLTRRRPKKYILFP